MGHVRFGGGSLLAYLSLLACAGATPRRPLVDAPTACEAVAYQSLRVTTKNFYAGQAALADIRERAPELNFRTIVRLEGAGARCVRGFKEGFFLMAHGAVHKIEGRGYLVERDRTWSPFAPADVLVGPALNRKEPQSVASLDRIASSSRRIAVWNLSRGSLVGIFRPGAMSDEVKIINRSDLTLRDINFVSDLDTPTGSVTVIHEIDPETVEVLGDVLQTTE